MAKKTSKKKQDALVEQSRQRINQMLLDTSSRQTLTEKQVRKLVEGDHIEPVIRALADICREYQQHCESIPDYQYIATEWRDAALLLDKAADIVEE